MTTSGTGIFYDGLTSDRRKVAVEIATDAIEVRSADGALLARWRLAEIYPLAGPTGVLRIGLANASIAARLEIQDQVLAAALLARTKPADRTGLTDSRTRMKVVAFSLAAIVTLVGGAIWGVPLLADRIAPHLPVALEIRLGAAVDTQVRQVVGASTGGKPVECGRCDPPPPLAPPGAVADLVTR